MLVEECEDTILAKFRQNQLKDKDLKDIMKQAMENRADGFVIVNGLLCKEVNGDTPIVVPKLMQTPIKSTNVVISEVQRRNNY